MARAVKRLNVAICEQTLQLQWKVSLALQWHPGLLLLLLPGPPQCGIKPHLSPPSSLPPLPVQVPSHPLPPFAYPLSFLSLVAFRVGRPLCLHAGSANDGNETRPLCLCSTLLHLRVCIEVL